MKGNQTDDQITSQIQLSELAERLKFIEQKLLENERNAEKKLQNKSQNITTSSGKPQFNQLNQQQNYLNAFQNYFQQNYQMPQFNKQQHVKQLNYEKNNYLTQENQDDLCSKNSQFRTGIYPSNSFGNCSEMNQQPKKKRHFFSSTKSEVKNSKSISSCKFFLPYNAKEHFLKILKILFECTITMINTLLH